ncbi:hypothetical protein [Kordiimonas marina]|uniref:hypothetical protein n=1 Tax=Kordiimonas marina TaxID=2872312 RepID=UPI001FF63A18|nr:hypothetical protein [Kordiimonas marina]MCJ9429308.1 hypothetical protein [Kordiimonas marina]
MVTDADLTEAGQLHQARDEAQNAVTIYSGVPARDGAVSLQNEKPTLRQGWVVAQGKQGRFVAADRKAKLGWPALFQNQADLPDAPALPGKPALLYADLWERPVFALQDSYLADPGLHGAETSYRTRTMTQIKALPVEGGEALKAAFELLEKGEGVFRRKGDALVSVEPKNTEIAIDDCDPCADKVEGNLPSVPNALFRLEVVEVIRDGAGQATQARFAWSMENAAAIETMTRLKDAATGSAVKEAFARDHAVYEYFSDTTEAQVGRFAPGITPKAPVFKATLTETSDTHVRRWDGCAMVNLTNSTIVGGSSLGKGKMTVAAGKATLTVDAFTAEIAFSGKDLLAGDYWLIELRRFAADNARVHLVGGTKNKSALPVGIEHHFCALFLIDGAGKPEVLPDAGVRRLSFPPLSDIPATHVSFDPDCPDFFDHAENVAEALNALCDLDASQVGFTPPDDCKRFEGATTVQQALARLCSIQDDTSLTRVLRLMMDWGVVCGIRPHLVKPMGTLISWSAGTMLDRTGRLIDVKAGKADLAALDPGNILDRLDAVQEREGEICLSFAAKDDGTLEIFLSGHDKAFGPTDPTFREAVEACIKGRKPIDFGGIIRPLKVKETATVKKMADVWSKRKALEGSVAMTESEGKTAKAVNKTLANDYFAKVDEPRKKAVAKMIAVAEREYDPNAVRGAVRDKRRMQLESIKFGIIATAEEEDRQACECRNLLVPCPPAAGKLGRLVPVGCIKLARFTPGVSAVAELCELCCRKQAMTWRSYRYFKHSFIDSYYEEFKERCCHPRDVPDTGIGDFLDHWYDHIYEPKLPEPPKVPDDSNPLWPPIKVPGIILGRDPRITDPIGPLFGGKLINPKPVIDRLPPKDATEVLVGNGFDVVGTVDLDGTDDPLAKLTKLGAVSDTVLGKQTPEPGDKVAVMSRGGKAVDYVVISKGSGKLPFETTEETAVRIEKAIKTTDLITKLKDVAVVAAPPARAEPGRAVGELPTAEIDALAERLKELETKRKGTEAEITRLGGLRDTLATEVSGLATKFKTFSDQSKALDASLAKSKTELANVERLKTANLSDITAATRNLADVKKERDAVAADIAKSKAELAEITRIKTANMNDIAAATRELASVKKDHAAFVETMRREQPVEAVVRGNPAAIRALKANGIVSVGDLDKTATNRLTTMLRTSGLSGTQIKTLTNNFVKRGSGG